MQEPKPKRARVVVYPELKKLLQSADISVLEAVYDIGKVTAAGILPIISSGVSSWGTMEIAIAAIRKACEGMKGMRMGGVANLAHWFYIEGDTNNPITNN